MTGIRCVVSVSMLTEGWDANTVTHILGMRAFGTQLLCEQVVGRGLRRQSYELNEAGRFNPEYADVFGIPFDFTSAPVVANPQPPKQVIRVQAIRPERDHLEIRFPRVQGYRIDLPFERLRATFTKEARLVLDPEELGPAWVRVQGIIGESTDMTLDHLKEARKSEVVFNIANYLLQHQYREPDEPPKTHFFPQLTLIVRQWLDEYLVLTNGTYLGHLLYLPITEVAAERIATAITIAAQEDGERPVKAILDPYNPAGSTSYVNFTTSKEARWETAGPPPKCHINWVMLDSDWEAEFCRIAETHPRVIAYAKNHALGFEVPYRLGSQPRRYLPDFLLKIDDGRPDPLQLVVEISGYPKGDKAEKVNAMQGSWVPGVNNLGSFGRWAFVEFTDAFEIEPAFARLIERFCAKAAA